MLARLPKWVDTDLFEIDAKVAGNPTKDQMRLMMQSLLAERFHLAVHYETQDIPIYALTLMKPGTWGPKLIRHADGPPCDVSGPRNPATGMSPSVFPERSKVRLQPSPGDPSNRRSPLTRTWNAWGGLSSVAFSLRRSAFGGALFVARCLQPAEK